jgi:hypothetical protein
VLVQQALQVQLDLQEQLTLVVVEVVFLITLLLVVIK